MSWDCFPVASGQRITAEMLNELRRAVLERQNACSGWSPFAAVSIGTRVSLQTLRARIDALIAATNYWVWVESYTDERIFTIHKLTSAASNPTANPKLKNIFELALGPGNTTWRDSVAPGSRPTARALNDMALVLGRMIICKLTSSSTSQIGRIKRAVGATCGAAVADADAASWEDPYSSGGVYHFRRAGAGLHQMGPKRSGFFWMGSRIPTVTIPDVRSGYSSITDHDVLTLYELLPVQWFHQVGLYGPHQVLRRDIDLEIRLGLGSAPTTYAEAMAFGQAVAQTVFESDTVGNMDLLFVTEGTPLFEAGNQPRRIGIVNATTIVGCTPCADADNWSREIVDEGTPAYFANFDFEKG